MNIIQDLNARHYNFYVKILHSFSSIKLFKYGLKERHHAITQSVEKFAVIRGPTVKSSRNNCIVECT